AQTRLELQNAADSAALAGASKLLDFQLQSTFASIQDQTTLRNNAISSARSEAQRFGQLNRAGGVQLVVNASDIVLGYLDSPTAQNTSRPTPPDTHMPNSVQVTVLRDSSVSTGPLPLFFAPVFGVQTTNVRASATATYQGGQNITGFSSPSGGANNLLLPLAI